MRDRDSYATARKYGEKSKNSELNHNVVLYQDFAQETILNESQVAGHKLQVASPYIMVNINKQSVNIENMEKIVQFCQKYPEHKKIFFPCDMNDDKNCFSIIKEYISDLEFYDRTKHSLSNSLSLFYHSDG